MASRDAQIKRYFRSISRELPCAYKMKKSIMQRIRESIGQFLEQNPEVNFEAVRARFGEPKAIALSYIEDQDGLELLKKMHLKRWILAMVAGVLAFIVLTWSGVVIWSAFVETDNESGYIILKAGDK